LPNGICLLPAKDFVHVVHVPRLIVADVPDESSFLVPAVLNVADEFAVGTPDIPVRMKIVFLVSPIVARTTPHLFLLSHEIEFFGQLYLSLSITFQGFSLFPFIMFCS
jgi:hypothetical protein